ILIELQYEREYDYLQRLIYGISKTITEHVREGDPYIKVQKVISISILYFDLGIGGDYIYHGATSFKGLHTREELILSESQKKMFNRQTVPEIFPELYLIKVSRFNDVARDTLDEWIYFLKNADIRENFTARGLKRAKEVLDILKLSEEERRAYDRYQEDLHFQASMVESTWVAGRIEGKEEGIQIGEQRGIQIGEQRGIQIGEQKGIQIGEQRGIQIGEQRGLHDGKTDTLLKLLRRKFGPTPDWVAEKVKAADLEQIEVWSDNFVFANSLDGVFVDRQ
ncbi:MAG: PD-(D/E)XK nuclease family transposase, partial [Magnetococcales bacterium]|nr:PD-(D/E)XK nuclease family transposase [Magnetococcales bacterium]